MHHHYCTYFDHRYLSKGLVMLTSLLRVDPFARIWVLALDDETLKVLTELCLEHIHLIPLGKIETGNNRLLSAKRDRSTIEYYFTLTPCLPRYLLANEDVSMITYLDADLYFCSDPAPLFRELGECSIGLVRHNWSDQKKHLAVFGIHNASWITFRADDIGTRSLAWYENRCLEWCFDRPENGKLADQGYLDEMPSMFDRAISITHKGANVASWNIDRYLFHLRGSQYYVDEVPLIFFHFHGLTFPAIGKRDEFNMSLPATTLGDLSHPLNIFIHEYLTEIRIAEQLLSSIPYYSGPKRPLRGNSLPEEK